MLSWLSGLIGRFTGALQAIWNDIVSLVTRVYNWLTSQVETVYHDILVAINGVNHLASEISSFVSRTYDTFVRWVDNEFRTVETWTSGLVSKVEKYAEDLYSYVVRNIDNLIHQIDSTADALTKWVLANIWNPLYNDIAGALHWIEKEGAFAYDLLTHPEKLTALLIGYIWNAWLSLVRQYSKPLMAFFLSQWKYVSAELVSVLEDVISTFF